MTKIRWIDQPKLRFAMAIGAGTAMGQMVFRALTQNVGPVAGYLAGIAATAVLIVGFFLLFSASTATDKRTQEP